MHTGQTYAVISTDNCMFGKHQGINYGDKLSWGNRYDDISGQLVTTLHVWELQKHSIRSRQHTTSWVNSYL